MNEEWKRSVCKTLSWRIIATCTTIFLVYIFTSQIVVSLGFGLIEMILKIVIYFLHERVWNRIEFGKRITV